MVSSKERRLTRRKAVLAVGAFILPLAACDDKTSDDATTQKATPDNKTELACRIIKECSEELQQLAPAKQDQFWDADSNKKIAPAQIDAINHTRGPDQSEQPQQADKPTQ